MNVPDIIWEGELKDVSIITLIAELLKKLIGRRGRLLWVDLD